MAGKGSQRGPMFAEEGGKATRRSLIAAISEIQELAMAEKMGYPLPDSMIKVDRKFVYSEVGVHCGVMDGVCNLIGIPLAIAVIWGIMPIFGVWEASWFGILLGLLFGVGYGLNFSWMIASGLGDCYYGVVCRRAIDYIYQALWVTQAVKVVLLFIIFHGIRTVITPESVHHAFNILWPLLRLGMGDESAVIVQNWLVSMREVFIVSSWLALASTAICLAIPYIYFQLGHAKAAEQHRRHMLYGR